jgi:UDP-N-acetylglucosamine--N-acetylmuramyl-(pentapeptide) pyrophosphoryl-undecaprenol N-acetylglucosamine transferase
VSQENVELVSAVYAGAEGMDKAALRAEARAHFGLPADGPVLLVFGGS